MKSLTGMTISIKPASLIMAAIILSASLLATTDLTAGVKMSFDKGNYGDAPGKQSFWMYSGSKMTMKVSFTDTSKKKGKADCRWMIVNESGEEMKKGAFEIEFGESGTYEIPIAITRNGSYRLELACTKDGEESKSETLFSIFPPLHGKHVEFGILGASIDERVGDLIPAIGLSWNRRHCATGRTCVYPAFFDGKGVEAKFKNSYFEKTFRSGGILEKKYGLGCMGSLNYNATNPAKMSDKDFDAYCKWWEEEYVTPLVKAGRGHIKYWEVTNEPYYALRECPDRFVALLKASHRAVKRIDPSIMVVGPSGPPDVIGDKFFRDVFSRGALEYMDVVSFHQYCFTNRTVSSPEKGFVKWFEKIRGLVKEYGGGEKPLWNTESSITPPATMFTLPETKAKIRLYRGDPLPKDPREQAAVATRVLTVHYAYDAKYLYHLALVNPMYTCHLFEYDGSPIAFSVAFAWMSRTFEGNKCLGDITPEGRMRWYAFTQDRQDEVMAVAWLEENYEGEKAALHFPQGIQPSAMYDIFGNPAKVQDSMKGIIISGEPVYMSFKLSPGKALDSLKTSELEMSKDDASAKMPSWCKRAMPSDWVGMLPIDLSHVANRSFSDDQGGDKAGGFTDEGSNDLRLMASGDILADGVPFRVLDPAKNNDKSSVVMGSRIRDYFPFKVSIPFDGEKGNRITKLHFLQLFTNCNHLPKGKVFAKYVINYSDGYKEEIPLAGGKPRDWWDGIESDEKIALNIPSPARDAGVYARHLEWTSSHPKGAQAYMTSIEVETSKDFNPIMVILAITAVLSN